MTKKEVKEFFKKHELAFDIIGLVGGGVLIGLGVGAALWNGGVVGKKCMVVTNKNLEKLLCEAQNEFGAGGITMFTGCTKDLVGPESIGTVGEMIELLGGAENKFKYFVAIGPDKK